MSLRALGCRCFQAAHVDKVFAAVQSAVLPAGFFSMLRALRIPGGFCWGDAPRAGDPSQCFYQFVYHFYLDYIVLNSNIGFNASFELQNPPVQRMTVQVKEEAEKARRKLEEPQGSTHESSPCTVTGCSCLEKHVVE